MPTPRPASPDVPPADADVTRLSGDATRLDTDVTRMDSADDRTRLSGDHATVLSSGSGRAAAPRPDLQPGTIFGTYRIERLLGRGGMGEVYEAEHLEHARHVALKVLNQHLAGDEDRARFLNEGRLAASINHPNSVYVYGSEEIDGTPIITMELLTGGTLKDRVAAAGPLGATDAVDAILQVVAGLDAAARIGVLHRDVKPSNCFIDHDGAVKVGDFGLSIATGRGPAGESGMFMGTPQFAAPEQMRGEVLDTRADIYAVGATLYYLLTGRPPFEDKDLTTLITRVKTEAPTSPRVLRPPVSRGLARVVLRLLAKSPADRPANYAAVAAALRPFGSAAVTPAVLAQRFGAGILDQALLMLLVMPFTTAAISRVSYDEAPRAGVSMHSSIPSGWINLLGIAVALIYYTLMEGVGDGSLGKRLCGLRVADASGKRLGVPRAALRTAIYVLPQCLAAIPALIYGTEGMMRLGQRSPMIGMAYGAMIYASMIVLFLSARRRNGFAALHDLATHARVVVRESRRARAASTGEAVAGAAGPGARLVGPFETSGSLGRTTDGVLDTGRDPVLQRQVWLHLVTAGTPALAAPMRALGRPGRLRWLMGRRNPGDAWDAYEAPDGAPFLTAANTPQPWSIVKHWLADLSREIAAATDDGTLPVLAIDRLWITRSNHAMLLEFGVSAPGEPEPQASFVYSQAFLAAVARRALAGNGAAAARDPLPLGAHVALERLEQNGFASPRETASSLAMLASGLDRVSRRRRASSLLAASAPVILPLIALLIALPLIRQSTSDDMQTLADCLKRVAALDGKSDAASVAQRTALEIYTANRFGARIGDDRFWLGPARVLEPRRSLAERIALAHPRIAPDELASATVVTQPLLAADATKHFGIGILFGALISIMLTLAAAAAIVISFITRGGLTLRVAGLALVTRDGRQASRSRACLRACLAWSPIAVIWIAIFVATLHGGKVGDAIVAVQPPVIALALLVVGAMWAIARPNRGIQDRLAGTEIVPL